MYFWICLAYVSGTVSLVFFVVFLSVGSFHLIQLDLSFSVALAWNTLLSAVFFIQHSGMVRRFFRQRLAQLVADSFHGLIYTIASGFILTLCMMLWQRTGEPIILFEGIPAWFCRGLFSLALLGFAWGAYALKTLDTFGVKPALSVLRGRSPVPSPFVVKGPYRWVRHPLYFFTLVLFWSYPAPTPDRLLFNVLWSVWIFAATFAEERDLVSHFGDSYVQYQRAVPRIFPWRPPISVSFSLSNNS